MKIFLYILLIAVLAGCALKPLDTLKREQFEQLPQKYSQFDFKLAWDSKITDNGVIIEGVAWNLRWFRAEGLEIWVSLLDSDGRVMAKEVDLVRPDPLKVGEMANFSIKLPVKPRPGSKLVFTYKFGAVEDVEGSTSWMQSFDSKL